MNTDNRTKEDPEFIQTNLRNNSIFNPQTSGNQCMGAFKKMVEDDLKNLENKHRKTKNMWKAIKQIGKKHKVVIWPVDKGGGLVILNKKDYREEMDNLLKRENTYKKLTGNPKKKYETKLKKYVNKGRKMGILNHKEAEYLVSNSTKTPDKPPGRPIIS